MANLEKRRVVEIPEADVGELFVTREAGVSSVVILAKVPLLKGFWENLSGPKGPKTEKVKMGTTEFLGFVIPESDRNRFVQRNKFSLKSSANPLVDEENGVSPLLTFLRHTSIAEGVEIPINYPVNPQDFAESLGLGLSAFVEEFLVPFKMGYEFYFVEK